MRFAPLLLLILVAGCSGKSASSDASTAAKKDPFLEKLQSLPENQRAEYARTHAAEAMASAGTPASGNASVPSGQ